MKVIKKLLFLLTSNEKKKLFFLFILTLFTAILDMLGVVSIMPFITVLLNPDIIETNSLLNSIFNFSALFGVKTTQNFLFFFGIIIFVFLIFSLFVKALTTYLQLRFVKVRELTIGKRLMEIYFYQPYSWFLNNNSADLGKNILSEVSSVVNLGLSPMLNLITNSIISTILLGLLMFIDFKLALIVGIVFGLFYFFIYKFVKNFLHYIGNETVKSDQMRFKVISEAFGASKEIKLGSLERFYIDSYTKPALKFSNNQALSKIISQIPRFAIEGITFGGLLLVTLILMRENGTLDEVLPIIALYAFAGYRLMPALQQIYVSFTTLRFVGPALDNLYKSLKISKKNKFKENKKKLELKNKITLSKVNYKYPNTNKNILKNINISLPAFSKIGIVGKSGSGKTTLIDLILGLLDVNQGFIKIDNQIINKRNQRSWQKSIAYVPQKIYLSDDSIAANIAFGSPIKDINYKKIIEASKIANLHEFVTNKLPLKYETKIGERGVRISGGQSQRIGIARALYHKKSLLVLDEATSALDYQTEKEVMEALNNISKEMTTIIIAHRLNTIKKCDKIFYLVEGKIKAAGNYSKLEKSNASFKQFISLN